jgi:cell division protein FtsQ
MAAVMAVIALVALALAITRLPILAVRHVGVTGNGHTPRAAVLAVTRLDRHPQMIGLNSGRLRHELLGLPWVASAQIHRHWPSTVDVHLSERVPVAEVAEPKGQEAILDRDGRVLVSGLNPWGPGLPRLDGVGQVGPAGTFLPASSGGRDALALVMALGPALPPATPHELEAVGIGHNGTLQATLAPSVTVLFGSIDGLDAKLLALQTLLERVDLKTAVTLDVRVPDAPALTHKQLGSTVSTTPRG